MAKKRNWFCVCSGMVNSKGEIVGGGVDSFHKTYSEAWDEANRLRSLKHPSVGGFQFAVHTDVRVLTEDFLYGGK